jgi:hypothetical protein
LTYLVHETRRAGVCLAAIGCTEQVHTAAGSLAGAALVAGLVAFTVWPPRTGCIATSGFR